MKRILVLFAVLLLVVGLSSNVMAVPLPNGTLLTIEPGVQPGGPGTPVISGSWWGIDAYATGSMIPTPLEPGTDGGILVGQLQYEPPNPEGGPSEPSGITVVWPFLDKTGVNVIHDPSLNSFDTNGTAVLGSWDILFNGADSPDETIDYWRDAVVDVFIVQGTAYTLEWDTAISSKLTWESIPYLLHLEGQIIVPEPATLLLLGTGLAGLLGLAKRYR